LLKISNQFIIKKIKSFCVSEIGRRQSIYSWQFLFKIIAEALVKSTTVFVIGIHTHNVSAKFLYLLVYGPDNKKKVAEISLDDQILLFIVQREAIVDITGTL